MGPQMMQKEACEPGNSVLQQLVEEQRIVAYYPLHHRAKRQWLSGSYYTLHPAPCTLHPTPCSLNPTPYTLHPAPYTLHPTPYTLHPTPYTLHPTPR